MLMGKTAEVMIGSLADFATFYAKRVLVFLRAARPFRY
jgi:hypothetical protein